MSSFGMGRDVHSLMLSIQHSLCRRRRRSPSRVPKFSWTDRCTAEKLRRIRAMEMRCYRQTLRISYKDHVTNKKVCAKILQTIGQHEDFLAMIKRRKLK